MMMDLEFEPDFLRRWHLDADGRVTHESRDQRQPDRRQRDDDVTQRRIVAISPTTRERKK